jgi:hypothetical protein
MAIGLNQQGPEGKTEPSSAHSGLTKICCCRRRRRLCLCLYHCPHGSSARAVSKLGRCWVPGDEVDVKKGADLESIPRPRSALVMRLRRRRGALRLFVREPWCFQLDSRRAVSTPGIGKQRLGRPTRVQPVGRSVARKKITERRGDRQLQACFVT